MLTERDKEVEFKGLSLPICCGLSLFVCQTQVVGLFFQQGNYPKSSQLNQHNQVLFSGHRLD